MKTQLPHLRRLALGAAVLGAAGLDSVAAPTVSRLTPPSALFTFGDPNPPVIARFLPGQRFDLEATITPDDGQSLSSVQFYVDNAPVAGTVSYRPATTSGVPAGTLIATIRAYSNSAPGIRKLSVEALQSDSQATVKEGNFEVVGISQLGRRAKNVIYLIGDGLGIAHRTAARMMLKGVQQGKANSLLAMDTFPNVGLVMTASLNSIITDSSPGAACYATGNKSNNNQQGVFPDDTTDNFDNPRVELIGEYLRRTQGKSLGIVTTSDVFDATPGSFGTHTQNRGAGTGICDQYLDEAAKVGGLDVLLGGGRKWFLPSSIPGSARGNSTDYVLPADLVSGWGVAAGVLDPTRDLIGDFQAAGFFYAPDNATLASVPAGTRKLLGLFSLSNMNVAKDKVDGPSKRNVVPAGSTTGNTIVEDYGFPDQPMLDDMTRKALDVLSLNRNGFTLMVEAASIDKQAHNMDTERWILDTIEFDRAVQVAKDFATANPDTLVIVTADHECAGVNIIGASRVTNAELITRSTSGAGTGPGGPRAGVVGAYESAGFPVYTIAADGYPETTDPDRKMLIGYAGNADRNEDWLTNPFPIRDSQQPFNGVAPLNTYPANPSANDAAGGLFLTGVMDPANSGASAVHTASDIPLSAFGRGSQLFNGVYDNTDVFFKAMQALLGGAR